MRTKPQWIEERIICVPVAVIKTEKEIGLIGRDVTQVHHNHNASLFDVKVLPAIKRFNATIKLRPDAKHVLWHVWKVPLAMEAKVKIELAKLQSQGITASFAPGDVMCGKSKKTISLALCRLQS